MKGEIVKETYFASPERAGKEVYTQDFQLLNTDQVVVEVMRSFPNIVLVLNEHRQIVFYNHALLQALGLSDGEDILGMRPGEVFNCVHVKDAPSGCGTSEFCQYCGAVLAILSALEGKSSTRECRIRYSEGDKESALDLSITASHTVLHGRPYIVFSIMDISDKKRRLILERIFFHDVLNTAGSLHTAISMVTQTSDPEMQNELIGMMPHISSKLLDEIKSQQELILAENGELRSDPRPIDTFEIINTLLAEYHLINNFDNLTIRIDDNSFRTEIESDPVLIKRVLSNMIKNAFEACGSIGEIVLGCTKTDSGVEFYVTNPGFMPDEVQKQIFKRSYSTKGKDRGLGTYSMKLLGETYLHGQVGFSSSKEEGTRFYLHLK